MVEKTEFSITFTKRTEALLRQAEKRLTADILLQKILLFFEKFAIKIAGNISRNFLSGQRLRRRTGTLARSIVGRGVRERGLPAIRVGVFRGPALAYAASQELGATIKPRKAKSLAIPQKAALTPAGVDRFGGPRNYPGDLKFIPFTKSGVAIGGLFDARSVEKERKRVQRAQPRFHPHGPSLQREKFDIGRLKFAYMLVKEVRIDPKHFLRDGMLESLAELAVELAKFIRQELYAERKKSRR